MIIARISNLEQCWLHGFKAFHEKVEETANPYSRGTKEFHYWSEGWWEGFYDTDNMSSLYENDVNEPELESLAS